ncbi:MAG: fumarylacetoacetate hydrolase family protein [Galbitalea sp.]
MRIARILTNEGSSYAKSCEDGWELLTGEFPYGLRGTDLTVGYEVDLLAPIAPRTVVAMAHNQRGMSSVLPSQAFLKSARTVIGPGGVIRVDPELGAVNAEAELAIVIGREARGLTPGNALDAVFGYTIGNDVTAAEQAVHDELLTQAKNGDGFTPLGPWIETELVDPDHCRVDITVNGRSRAQGSTADLLATVVDQLVYVTRYLTLGPGDVLLGGCPGTLPRSARAMKSWLTSKASASCAARWPRLGPRERKRGRTTMLAAETWPIVAALLPFPAVGRDGGSAQTADTPLWRKVFAQVARAGFQAVDLTDSWVRIADLDAVQLDRFAAAAHESGLSSLSVSLIRRSVIDPDRGDDNLEYSHRAIEAAAHLGAVVVSVGLHRPLSEEQRSRLWFWTAGGHKDPVGDRDVWDTAVRRFRELGDHAAQLGVLLSLELYEDTYLGTAESAVRLVEEDRPRQRRLESGYRKPPAAAPARRGLV